MSGVRGGEEIEGVKVVVVFRNANLNVHSLLILKRGRVKKRER